MSSTLMSVTPRRGGEIISWYEIGGIKVNVVQQRLVMIMRNLERS